MYELLIRRTMDLPNELYVSGLKHPWSCFNGTYILGHTFCEEDFWKFTSHTSTLKLLDQIYQGDNFDPNEDKDDGNNDSDDSDTDDSDSDDDFTGVYIYNQNGK